MSSASAKCVDLLAATCHGFFLYASCDSFCISWRQTCLSWAWQPAISQLCSLLLFLLPSTPLFISLFFRYSFLINRLRVLIAAFQRPRQVVIQPSRVLIPALLTVQSVCRPSFGGESFFWASRLRHDFLCIPSAFQVSDIKLFLHIF